ncbi:MAG TPA: glycosyltransferase, partial [Chitinophagaceae bacterium]|nr:glycosyltransferase [Chitinophagaceae bacterium]
MKNTINFAPMKTNRAEVSISIVLCTCNGEKYLVEQMNSLIHQTYPFLELIIVDDASTDSTYDILQSYRAKDKRIKIFRNEKNLGFNKNFEKAIGLASGEWISLADQDDVWVLEKLEIMSKNIDKNVSLIHCSSSKFQHDNIQQQKHYSRYQKFYGNDRRKIYLINSIEGHAMLMHRNVLQKAFPLPENIYFDWWIGFHAALQGTVVWDKNVLVKRRIHDKNSSLLQIKKLQKEKKQHEQALHYTQLFNKYAGKDKKTFLFGQKLESCLTKAIRGEKWPLFLFVMQYRKIVFYYKPKRPIIGFFSYCKA